MQMILPAGECPGWNPFCQRVSFRAGSYAQQKTTTASGSVTAGTLLVAEE